MKRLTRRRAPLGCSPGLWGTRVRIWWSCRSPRRTGRGSRSPWWAAGWCPCPSGQGHQTYQEKATSEKSVFSLLFLFIYFFFLSFLRFFFWAFLHLVRVTRPASNRRHTFRNSQGLLYHRTCKPDFLCSW